MMPCTAIDLNNLESVHAMQRPELGVVSVVCIFMFTVYKPKSQAESEDLGGVLRTSISGLARYVALKAWVSCHTKVALF